MLLAIIFFNVWGVLQLAALGSFARTVRVRTVLAAIAVGVFFCTPLAALLEYTWAAAVAALTGRPVEAVIAVTGYTLDPPIEEVIRILPLAFLLIVPAVRRQISVTDCVLIGAAAGAGFGLAEDLYRFGTAPQHATAIPAGWIAPYQSPIVASAGGNAFIPSIATAMGGWLPDMGGYRLFGLSAYMLPNLLLIWSALAGLAVGVWLRLDGPKRWLIVGGLLAYASGAHAASNADITFGRPLLVTAPFRALAEVQTLLPILALAFAWWIDRRRQGEVLPEHLLAAERGASPRAVGSLRAAMARVPESIFWVDRFVRLRRAYNTERHVVGPEADTLRVPLEQVRALLDDRLQEPGSWRATSQAWAANVQRVLRQPLTIVWIVLTLPSLLWFVAGGWPATAGVQRLLTAGPGLALVVGLTVAAQALMAWRMLSFVRSWRRLLRIPIADSGATVMLSLIGGVGALGFGAFGVARAATPSPPALAHAIDALISALLGPLVALANLAAGLMNYLFPSTGNLHIPVPGAGPGFVTPTGLRQAMGNKLINKAFDTFDQFGNTLDPFRSRRIVPQPPRPQMKVGSGDPNDMSEGVGNVLFEVANYIFDLAMLFGGLAATGSARAGSPPPMAPRPGAAPPVDPALQPTLPGTPPRSPMATSVNVPGVKSPMAESVNVPGARSPMAESVPPPVRNPALDRTVPAPAPNPALDRTVPAPAANPALDRTAPAPGANPALDRTVPAPGTGSRPVGQAPSGTGPFQGDPANREWLANTPGHPAVEAMGGVQAYDRADAASSAAYNDARNAGMTDQAARQASYEAWHKQFKPQQGSAPNPPSGGPENLTPGDTRTIDDP